MLKIKERVNQNLLLPFWVLLSVPVFAGESGHFLAEREGREFRVIQHKNPKLVPPMGSLLKPFAAWYLLEKGLDHSKRVFCPAENKRTTTLRCWTPDGHGAVSLQDALVQSCNYFFLMQFQGLRLSDYEAWLKARFDWPDDLPILHPENVYGFNLPHGVSADKIIQMYSRLLNASENGSKDPALIVEGLRGVCQGTLHEFCRRFAQSSRFRLILGKTGTVLEGKRNFGVALLFVEDLKQNKKVLLLCYEKNRMGSEAALNALKIFNAYDRKTDLRNHLNR